MSREDVLDAFCVEPDNGPETLVRYLRDYPEYAADLTQLSIEMSKPLPEKTGPLSASDKALIAKSWDQFQARIASINGCATHAILGEILNERNRQESLCAAGKFSMTAANPNLPIGGKLCVLAEEFGEVSKEACQLYDPRPGDNQAEMVARLRAELIQLAAVAVAWVESIDAESEEAA